MRMAPYLEHMEINTWPVANEPSAAQRPAQNRRGRKIGLAKDKKIYAEDFGTLNG